MSILHELFVSLLSADVYLNPQCFPIEHKRAHTVHQLSDELRVSNIVSLQATFLFEQDHPDHSNHESLDIPEHDSHYHYNGKIKMVNLASALFYVPSDVSGVHDMWQEFIHSTPL